MCQELRSSLVALIKIESSIVYLFHGRAHVMNDNNMIGGEFHTLGNHWFGGQSCDHSFNPENWQYTMIHNEVGCISEKHSLYIAILCPSRPWCSVVCSVVVCRGFAVRGFASSSVDRSGVTESPRGGCFGGSFGGCGVVWWLCFGGFLFRFARAGRLFHVDFTRLRRAEQI